MPSPVRHLQNVQILVHLVDNAQAIGLPLDTLV